MDWEPTTVVATELGVSPTICRSINTLLKEGCTIPFICRYRKGAIGDTIPETVRAIARRFENLEDVAMQTTSFIRQNANNKARIVALETGASLVKNKNELEQLRALIIPDSLELQLRKCTQLEEVKQIISPFRPAPKPTRAIQARLAGLQPIFNALMNEEGCDLTTSYVRNTVPTIENHDELLAGLGALLADSIAKDSRTFQLVQDMKPPTLVTKQRTQTENIPATTTLSSDENSSSVSATTKNGSRMKRINKPIHKSDHNFGKLPSGEEFEMYFDFSMPVVHLKPHHVLAINRGEKFKFLRVSFIFASESLQYFERSLRRSDYFGVIVPSRRSCGNVFSHKQLSLLLETAIKDAWTRLIKPQLVRRIRAELTRRANEKAIEIFSRNLKALLLTPGIQVAKSSLILSLDPGFTHGCKYAILSSTGVPQQTGVLWLHGKGAKSISDAEHLKKLLCDYPIEIVAVGDGTASRETEVLLTTILEQMKITEEGSRSNCSDDDDILINKKKKRKKNIYSTDHDTTNNNTVLHITKHIETNEDTKVKLNIKFVSVNEKGVSIWSIASQAESELPHYPPEIRSAISIGRRLINPLCEYTKVDPKNLGVGLYQHDIPAKDMKRALESVTEECVSLVGVDLNIAPLHMLANIAGLGEAKAQAIIGYREKFGPFTSRLQLKNVSGIGQKTFEQCAGFLRLRYSSNRYLTAPFKISNGDSDSEMTVISNNNPINKNKISFESSENNTFKKKRNRSSLNNSNSHEHVVFKEEEKNEASNLLINPLDSTWIHPDNYDTAKWVIQAAGVSINHFGTVSFQEAVGKWFINFRQSSTTHQILQQLNIDLEILKLIVDGLTSSDGFIDVRSTLTPPLLRTRIINIADINNGQQLKGRITNITSFGVFVDIGIEKDALIHTSMVSTSLEETFTVGQILDVVVISIDRRRGRISLDLVKP